jgi:hypothetical protein
MVFVVLLLVLGGFMAANARKARAGDMTAVGRMPIYNRLATTCFLLIMVFAVLTFD